MLGVDHFGKNLEAGTRGASSKEASGDLVLACLGDKELSGNVINTRLAVRKNRGGRQGQEYPFTLRIVEAPEPDEDGEPITTMVVDWVPAPPGGAQPQPDPWAQARRQDQRTAVLRLKRVLMGALADQGVELPIPPDGPSGADGRSGDRAGAVLMPTRRPMVPRSRKGTSGARSSCGRSTGPSRSS